VIDAARRSQPVEILEDRSKKASGRWCSNKHSIEAIDLSFGKLVKKNFFKPDGAK